MPGRKPADAVRAYIEPIQQAFSCLQGVAKVNHVNRANKVGDVGAWILNVGGMELPNFGHLEAQQRYELVLTSEAHFADTGERYRVSTRGTSMRYAATSMTLRSPGIGIQTAAVPKCVRTSTRLSTARFTSLGPGR